MQCFSKKWQVSRRKRKKTFDINLKNARVKNIRLGRKKECKLEMNQVLFLFIFEDDKQCVSENQQTWFGFGSIQHQHTQWYFYLW